MAKKRTTKNEPAEVETVETVDNEDVTADFEARIVGDETPERYLVRLDMVSRTTGEAVKPGQVVTRAGFLAGRSDEDVNLLLMRGAIVPQED